MYLLYGIVDFLGNFFTGVFFLLLLLAGYWGMGKIRSLSPSSLSFHGLEGAQADELPVLKKARAFAQEMRDHSIMHFEFDAAERYRQRMKALDEQITRMEGANASK